MRKIVFYIIYICITALYACGNTNKSVSDDVESQSDSSLNIEYAKGFDILYHKDYKEVLVHSPWLKNELMSKYYVVTNPSIETPKDGVKLVAPLNSVAISSCTHVEFISQIGEIETIKGVCTPHLIYNPIIANKLTKRAITDIGDAFNLNIERLLHLQTDAIMLASYNQHDETSSRLQQSGVPVIFNNEWTESSLLARAEWIKFVAVFYGKEKEAEVLFNNIAERYVELSMMTDTIVDKTSILVGGNFKGTWYVPGGRSYMGNLFKDGGANYFYANDTTEQSIPLNFESVLLNFNNAEVWLNAPASTMQELYSMDEKHKLFLSAKNNKVYAFNKRLNATGANDFWESAVMNPHLVLCDIIWALYPHLMTDYTPSYIIKLKDISEH